MVGTSQSHSAKLGIHNKQKSHPGSQGCTQSISTSLAPIQGSQLMEALSSPSPTSHAAPAKITEHSKYSGICTRLGKICPEGFAMSSDWDEDDQAKDKEKDQKQPQTSPSFVTMMTKTLQPPKPYISKYFESMTSKTPIINTSKEK